MILAALCFIWGGMVLGISFLETPVKFTAPSVTLAIGLDVGRHVFGAFNKVEIGFALLAFGLLMTSRVPRVALISLSIVAAILALQSLWLLPILDARVQLIFDGKTPPSAPHHIFYVALELTKVACLLGVGRGGAARFEKRRAAAVKTCCEYSRRLKTGDFSDV